MTEYYNKEGAGISKSIWNRLICNGDYSLLKSTFLDNGTMISTTWVGVAEGYDNTGPLIFKIFVTDENNMEETYLFSTKERALEHHKTLCDNGTTYLGNESPNRWQQICWEINNKKENT